MKEAMRNQIEEMKKQSIGVEVEMAGITREKAARIASKLFGTYEDRYTGGTHGYSTYSAFDEQGREWKFASDSSIQDPNGGCELVTPILGYEDIPLLQELVRQLRHAGAKSTPSLGCGVHVHIGARNHTPQTLRTLTNLMASHEGLITEALNLDRRRVDHYCQTVDPHFLEELNRQKPKSQTELAEIWYSTQPGGSRGRNWHYHTSRYHMMNLHAYFTKGTIEFRLFQFDEPDGRRKGGLHAGQLKAYIQFCLAISQQAKTLKYASPKPQQVENPKFAMRTWLLRLGFIGEEFATAREVLTKRLEGDTAFRFGRPA